MDPRTLNSLSLYLIKSFEKIQKDDTSRGAMQVNPIVSEIASWYEKLRNVMEYREDEVILRGAIERILKRRLILGGSGKTVARALARELIWARYFSEEIITEEMISKIENTVDLHLKLKELIVLNHNLRESIINAWIYEILSSDIEYILNQHVQRELLTNYIFHVLKDRVTIADDTEETRDIQVFIAVRRSYAKNDNAFLRFHLFEQFFGKLSENNIEQIAKEFSAGYKKIERELAYPARFRILSYIRRLTPAFLILEDVLVANRDKLQEFLASPEELSAQVYDACNRRYKNIAAKVRRAIVRSVIFLFFTKTIFAFAIEGTYEQYLFGVVNWGNIGATIIVPPFLMALVSFFIKTPDKKNSERILDRINILLFDPHPVIATPLIVRHIRKKTQSITEHILTAVWFMMFIISFGILFYILSRLHFNIISQIVFVFFLTVVTFLGYRIYKTAHTYTVGDKQRLITPLVDILFLPIAQVGRTLTDGISQINIFLFLLDFVIEAPFKAIFGFFEQLFSYFHTKREYLE